jgi:hypothetical protein
LAKGGFGKAGGMNLDTSFKQLKSNPVVEPDIQKDIQKDNKLAIKEDSQTDIQADIESDIHTDTGIVDKKSGKTKKAQLAAFIASKKSKKKDTKVFVGLHLPEYINEILTQFKKDTDTDKSEAVVIALRLYLKDYLDED